MCVCVFKLGYVDSDAHLCVLVRVWVHVCKHVCACVYVYAFARVCAHTAFACL